MYTTVLHQYQRSTGHELEKTIRDRFHGAAQVALLSLGRGLLRTWGVGVSHGKGAPLLHLSPSASSLGDPERSALLC